MQYRMLIAQNKRCFHAFRLAIWDCFTMWARGGFSYRIFNRLMEVVGRIGDLGVKSRGIGVNGGV